MYVIVTPDVFILYLRSIYSPVRAQVGNYLERIWIMGFRAVDDIKETVRSAGDGLCRSVSSLTLRLCDISLTSEADAKATLAIVLPFLLSKGIMSTVNDVRHLSVHTIVKLVKVRTCGAVGHLLSAPFVSESTPVT